MRLSSRPSSFTRRHGTLARTHWFERDLGVRAQLLQAEGRLKALDAELLAQRIIDLISEGKRDFVLDVTGLETVNGEAATPLLRAARRLRRRKGRLMIVADAPSAELLHHRLDDLAEFPATRDAAMSEIGRPEDPAQHGADAAGSR